MRFEGRDWLKEIYEDDSKEIVIQKSAQCGISEYLLARSFFLADVRKATGLFCHPRQAQLNDFSHARIDPPILFSPHLKSRVSGINNVGLKDIGGNYIYFRGMSNLDQIISIDADFLVLDEYDQMTQAHIPTVKKRLGASWLSLIILAGNPTFPDYGINAKFNASDGREWFVKCEACNKKQVLNMDDNIFGAEDSREPWFGCSQCKREIDHSGPGEWVASRPDKEVHGYHISKLMLPNVTAKELVKNAAESEQDHYRFDLGLPYAREGGRIGSEMLNACRGGYSSTKNSPRGLLGVDVGRVLNCAFGEPGKALSFFTVKEFSELDRIMKTGNIAAAVVDALPETRAAKVFADKYAGRVWLSYYHADPKKDAHLFPRDRKREVHLHRTQTLDATFDELRDRTYPIPDNSEAVPDLYSQICAPIRVEKRDAKTGNMIAFYDEFGKPDHYAHALNYLRAAEWVLKKKNERRILTRGVIA